VIQETCLKIKANIDIKMVKRSRFSFGYTLNPFAQKHAEIIREKHPIILESQIEPISKVIPDRMNRLHLLVYL